MCRSVRDADSLDSLKPHSTVNDVSSQIEFKKGAVNLQCTRFKTRIRPSENQVKFTLHTIRHITSDRRAWYDGNVLCYHSTSCSRPTKATSKDT